MKKYDDNVVRMMSNLRKYYERQQRFHYLTFAAYTLILLLDFIIIIYVRAVHLNAYAWAGIIFLFTLLGVEAKQYNDFKQLKESVDDFYLRGEYGLKQKIRG